MESGLPILPLGRDRGEGIDRRAEVQDSGAGRGVTGTGDSLECRVSRGWDRQGFDAIGIVRLSASVGCFISCATFALLFTGV